MSDGTNRLVAITGTGRVGQVGEALAFAQQGETLALIDRTATEVQACGALLYVGSPAALAHAVPKGMAACAAVKSDILAVMRAGAADEAEHGVRANSIAPTAIRTTSNLVDRGHMTRSVSRESVADVATFLAGQRARNIAVKVISLA